MKAIVITSPGGPEVLRQEERPQPAPGEGEVLIEVEAAGVNRPDISQRKGNYPPPAGASPDIPGLEVAGTIAALGKGANHWKMGDRVCALVTGGGYAEYVAVPAGQCLPVPANLSIIEAASLPETYFTVWSNVFDRGHLQRSDTFLVHGGSGGIGSTAIQLAKAWGATVFTTAGGPDKCAFCEGLGATKAIDYKSENFAEVIPALTETRGVDVILDMIGGAYTAANIAVLAREGRLVLINFMKGEEATIKLGPIMQKRLTITGSTLRPRDPAFKANIAAQLEKTVWPWLAEGKVKPVVCKTFSLQQADEAHRFLENGNVMGKVVLLTRT